MNIFVACSSPRDREALSTIHGCNFHFLDAPLLHCFPSPDFDLLKYIDQCCEYISSHQIDAIIYSHDIATLVAAILCKKFNLVGPSVESMFLCLHKYYSRRAESSPIHFDYIDIAAKDIFIEHYPCYVKPPWLRLGIMGFKLESPNDLKQAICVAKKELPKWSHLYYPLFEKYIDLEKYPLATKDILLIEDFIEGDQITVDGWIYEGEAHIWAITDTNTYPGTRVVDNYSCPSRKSAYIQHKAKNYAIDAIKRVGVNNGFFNVEFWCHEDSVTLTEINGRAATIFYKLYRNCLGACVYEASVSIACRRTPPISILKPIRVAGQFNIVTFGEDIAENLLDFEYARSIEELTLYVSQGDWITPVSEFGFVLARLDLAGESYDEIHETANELRRQILKQPSKSPEL